MKNTFWAGLAWVFRGAAFVFVWLAGLAMNCSDAMAAAAKRMRGRMIGGDSDKGVA